MEALVKSCNICCVWSGMPNNLQNNKVPMSLERVELFYLLHLVTHPWKLHCYHVFVKGIG